MNTATVFASVSAILAATGGASLVVVALSGWLARVVGNRIAQEDRARVDAELVRLRSGLSKDTAAELDALTRRREVYARLAKALRVFINAGPDPEMMQAKFLEAYDDACVWAAEPVIKSLEDLLALLQNSPLDQARLKPAYVRCMLEMRRDSGFPATTMSYQFVSFPAATQRRA